METYCSRLNGILWDPETAESLLTRAAKAVDKAAAGNLERDHIHTQPFTENLVKYCKGATEG